MPRDNCMFYSKLFNLDIVVKIRGRIELCCNNNA